MPTIADGRRAGLRCNGVAELFIPAKTPPEIVRKISADTNTALADPAIKDKLAKTGLCGRGSSSDGAACVRLRP